MTGQGTAQDQLFYAFNLDDNVPRDQSRRDRKKVEMLFAHLKRIMKLDRLRLRGLSGAQDEFLLAATAQNLRRMAKWLMPIEGHAAVKSV
ncbi:hypothetical protein D9M72_185790 [compost metagenome]